MMEDVIDGEEVKTMNFVKAVDRFIGNNAIRDKVIIIEIIIKEIG
jgi:hypothetical protein